MNTKAQRTHCAPSTGMSASSLKCFSVLPSLNGLLTICGGREGDDENVVSLSAQYDFSLLMPFCFPEYILRIDENGPSEQSKMSSAC